jgi:1-deoxy-D-xylulose-5-phosphate reductoisomerase
LVTAGELMIAAASRHGATILPIDSEHNAIFQCLVGNRKEDIAKIVLTASGGPFRTAPPESLKSATPAQAVAHPNWSMGAKISVDSATCMNKGLELIEAHYLFGLPSERIDIVIHPQSVVHSCGLRATLIRTFCNDALFSAAPICRTRSPSRRST